MKNKYCLLLISLCIISTHRAHSSTMQDFQDLTRATNELQTHMYLCEQYTKMLDIKELFLTPAYHQELKEIGPTLVQSCTKKHELMQLIISIEKKLLAQHVPAALIEQIVMAGVLIKKN